MKRRLIALLLLFAVPTAFFSACTFNLRQVSGKLARGSQTLVSTLRANDPNHPSLPEWEAFAKGAASFDARVNANEDPLTLLRALAEIVTSFRQDILPILGNNVALIVAAAVTDETLRDLADHFTKEAGKVSKRPGTVARAAAVRRAAQDVDVLKEYLQTEKVKKP